MAKKEHIGNLADAQSKVPVQRSQERFQRNQRVLNSEELFGDQREVLIAHGDDVYRLRKTRFGKLILSK